MTANLSAPEIGDRVYFYGRGDAMVCGILAERAIGPLTGNPRYRVVDLPSEMRDPEAGRWVPVEEVYGIYPALSDGTDTPRHNSSP